MRSEIDESRWVHASWGDCAFVNFGGYSNGGMKLGFILKLIAGGRLYWSLCIFATVATWPAVLPEGARRAAEGDFV